MVAAFDWAATPIGGMESWPQSLRSIVSLCLASPLPMNVIWGAAHTQIYNDAHARLLGADHPAALGAGFLDASGSIDSGAFLAAWSGEPRMAEDQPFYPCHDGMPYENFRTVSFAPVQAEGGEIGGVVQSTVVTTPAVISPRRGLAMRDLTLAMAQCRTEGDIVSCAGRVLSERPQDFPFVLFYLPVTDGTGGYRLAGSIGLPPGTAAAPERMGAGGTLWPVDPPPGGQIVEGIRALLPDGVGPYAEVPERALVVRPRLTGVSSTATLVMVAGLSTRLRLDDLYRGLIVTAAEKIGRALAIVQAQVEHRQVADALRELNTAKSRLFANVSHEFRTPLTLMLGPVEDALADGSALPAPQRERLEIVQRNAHRLLKLVNLLLNFSRVEAGQTQAHLEPVDLAALTGELAGGFRAVCRRAGLELRIDCPPLSVPVPVDRDMWEKIVLNLMSNAFKFTRAGHIAVELRELGGAVRLSVRDTGGGIAPDHLGHVFERFYRADVPGSRTQEGTGIGLALVSDLVKLHGGEVGVESVAGEGSSFHVTLPVAARAPAVGKAPAIAAVSARAGAFAEEAERWLPHAGTGAGPEGAAQLVAGGGERPRIVLADDNQDMRQYVAGILSDAGYQVEACANGAQALEAVRRGPQPDLLLMDVMMPDLGGLELLRQLRADPATQGVLVILLSAAAGEEARVEGIAAGADDYLVKPFSARELRARIDGAVRLSRARQAAAGREQALMLRLADQEAKAALRQTEEELAFALQAGRLGAWSLDLATDRFTCSEICGEIMGLGPDNRPETHAELMQRVLQEDVVRQRPAVRRAIAQRELMDLEYRVRRPDGSIAGSRCAAGRRMRRMAGR